MDDTARKAIADNLRFYADARFKQLTIFLTWMTLLVGGLFQFGDKPFALSMGLATVLPVAALLITATFWILEIRTTLYWRAHRDRSPDLWPAPPTDGWRHINSTNAIFGLFVFVYICWCAASWKLSVNTWIQVSAAILGLTVLTFGVSSYVKYAAPGSTLKSDA